MSSTGARIAAARMATLAAAVATGSLQYRRATPTTAQCQAKPSNGFQQQPRPRRPPRFGASVPGGLSKRWFSSAATPDHSHPPPALPQVSSDRDDCPVCQKYSQGPCGSLFETWLQCTDQHPGTDASTGQDAHLSKCAQFAAPLAQCLEQHQAFYDKLLITDNAPQENSNNEDELQQAWTRLVREELAALPLQAFPLRPTVELRPRDSTVAVGVPLQVTIVQPPPQDDVTLELVLAYVTQNTAAVLSAGAKADLYVSQQRGWLQFGLPQRDIPSLTVTALYETRAEDEHQQLQQQVLYTHTVQVPPGL